MFLCLSLGISQWLEHVHIITFLHKTIILMSCIFCMSCMFSDFSAHIHTHKEKICSKWGVLFIQLYTVPQLCKLQPSK